MPVELGMSTLELSSHLLEIHEEAYRLICQILIGCLLLSQKYCKLVG